MVKLIVSILFLALAHVAIAGKLNYGSLERSTLTQPFVVNGTDANIEDYPWIVSIRYFGSHSCGGSILSEKFVLTAAHCSGSASVMQIQYGTHTIGGSTNVVPVDRWIVHEEYDDDEIENDIALVVPRDPLILGPNAQPVKLTAPFYEVPGSWDTVATLVGFGLDRTGGSIQTRLQEADLFVVSNVDCNNLHQFQIFDTNICAGIQEGGKGQCSGDSGGPLTLKTGEQVGIVSWSMKPCTVAPYPGVYTKVSHYIGWLEDKTGLKFS